MFDENALNRLIANRRALTRQQFKTLRGQIFHGDSIGAMKGLDAILQRNMERGSFE